jgi:predicted site-specific integrase-resolvase
MSGQVDIVAVTYRDRLARFDLEHLFDKHDVRVEVVLGDGSEDRQELVENLLEVVSSFAGKLYGTGRRRRSSLTAFRRLLEDREGWVKLPGQLPLGPSRLPPRPYLSHFMCVHGRA